MANLDVVDNITVFEVDEILAHRGRGYKVEYLVRWRGFDETYDSWEPTKSLAVAASDAIYQYRQSVPSLKSPKRASLSREKRGPADPVKNERSSTTTTKTVHVTQTVMTEGKNTQSDSSSREGSPTTSRRILRGRKSARDGMKVVDDRAAVKTLDEGAVSQAGCIRTLLTTPCRLCSCVRLRMSDIPIVVLVMSLLVIAITFYA